MSGRPKQRVFQYNENGKFLKYWDCKNDFRKEYFPADIGIRPLFTEGDIMVMEDNTIASISRIGRVGVKAFLKRYRSPYVDRKWLHGTFDNKKVVAYNLDNEKIAEFKDWDFACKLMNISRNTLNSRIRNGSTHGRDGLKIALED
jgi:hypothetical protein